jgi:hypothetical protein
MATKKINQAYNPRALQGVSKNYINAKELGSTNIGSYVYRTVKANAVQGDRYVVTFEDLPEFVKATQFAKFMDLVNNDIWMKACIEEQHEGEYRLSFQNQVTVLFS